VGKRLTLAGVSVVRRDKIHVVALIVEDGEAVQTAVHALNYRRQKKAMA
jgi:hypothetical protein